MEKIVKTALEILVKMFGMLANIPWQQYVKATYTVKVRKVAPGTKVFNNLEGSEYTTNEVKCFVITGTVGEQWPVDEKKLRGAYNITDEVMAKLEAGKEVVIQTRPDGIAIWAIQIPLEEGEFTQDTSWGDILTGNRHDIPEHGTGDYLVAADDNGRPSEGDRWIVNGEVFSRTYRKK